MSRAVSLCSCDRFQGPRAARPGGLETSGWQQFSCDYTPTTRSTPVPSHPTFALVLGLPWGGEGACRDGIKELIQGLLAKGTK